MYNSQLETALIQPSLKNYGRRARLPLLSDQLWRVESGIVRTLTWTKTGDIATLGLWGSGDLVGRALSSADPLYAECLTPVSVVNLHKNYWHLEMDAIIRHIHLSQELLEIVRCGNAEIALHQLLTWLARRFGRVHQQGWQIDLYLTHQQLADLSGLTRVTVTRLLKAFEARGVIQRCQRQILILPEKPFGVLRS